MDWMEAVLVVGCLVVLGPAIALVIDAPLLSVVGFLGLAALYGVEHMVWGRRRDHG